ncbi:MAG TPA: lasso peptide biosynthesis B2 protein [Candidatus Saccharimonadales bacterium]|nr:lasso peptide biosynthesis B2 protein [Candidatus Saccharimonadales bacterium]
MPVPFGAPELRGAFGRPNHPTHDSKDGVVLDDVQQLRQTGMWLDGELRIARHPLGSAVLYGDCLASEQAVDSALERALTTNDPNALTHLPGSYTTLLFEPHRLTALGDLANQYPLYYRKEGNGIVYGSATQPLREGMVSPQLDMLAAAGRLALSLPTDLVAGRSATEGIGRLEGGHKLTADRQSGTIKTEPYETFESPHIKTIDDAAAALREALLEAVRLRAHSGYALSADFSGGLDSTTAAYLLSRDTRVPLPIGTMYTAGMPSADLNQVQRLLALPASRGLFDHKEFVQTAAHKAYGDLLGAPPSDEPDDVLIAHHHEDAYNQFIRDLGGKLHVNGSGADCLFDADPMLYVGDWARSGSYTRFARGAAEAARWAKTSPLRLARQSVIRSKLTPSKDLGAVSRILLGQKDPSLLQHGGWLFGSDVAAEWLTPGIRKELSDLALARADAMRQGPQMNYGNHFSFNALKNISYDRIGSMRRTAECGLRQRAIYMDHAVIRACLSIPASLRMNPWTFKAILVKATKGLIPPEVTARGTKGDYTQQAVRGLRAALPDLDILLKKSRLAEMGIIDPKAVQKTFDRISIRTMLPWGSLETFVATELWYRDVYKYDPGSPPPPNNKPKEAQAITPIANETVLSMPPSALMVAFDTGGVTLQLAKNQYYRHNSSTLEIMRILQKNGAFGAVMAQCIAANPGVPEDVLRAMVSQDVRELIDMGVLAEGRGAFSIAKATANRIPSALAMTRQNQERASARLRDYPVAIGGFVLAAALRRLPLGAQMRTLEHIHRYWADRPANEASAARMYAAVQNVAEFHPARAACFEVPAATVLAAALKKRRINLILGVSSDLTNFHAWPETNGIAIRTNRDPEVVGIFEPILSV